MRKSTFLIAGIALGVLITKSMENNSETKKNFDRAADKVREFATAVATGFREQESKLEANHDNIPKSRKRTTPATKRSR